jgi:hypothetical protein
MKLKTQNRNCLALIACVMAISSDAFARSVLPPIPSLSLNIRIQAPSRVRLRSGESKQITVNLQGGIEGGVQGNTWCGIAYLYKAAEIVVDQSVCMQVGPDGTANLALAMPALLSGADAGTVKWSSEVVLEGLVSNTATAQTKVQVSGEVP